MDDQYKELVERMFTSLSFVLTESGKIPPTFIMVQQDDSVLPIMVAKEEINTREYASLSIAAASEINAKALILVCEQSMIKKKKDDPQLLPLLTGECRPSDDPDCEDYLTIIYFEKNGNAESLISKIHSDLGGRRYTIDFKWVDYSLTNLITSWE